MTNSKVNIPFTLTIRKCSNGFTLEYYEYLLDDTITLTTDVIQEHETFDEKGELDAMKRLLYAVAYHFDPNITKDIQITYEGMDE